MRIERLPQPWTRVPCNRPNLWYGMNEQKEMRMGDGVSWIAHAFKLFDALINPRRPPQKPRPQDGRGFARGGGSVFRAAAVRTAAPTAGTGAGTTAAGRPA